jgi:hypothetical protein
MERTNRMNNILELHNCRVTITHDGGIGCYNRLGAGNLAPYPLPRSRHDKPLAEENKINLSSLSNAAKR